ncbi:hypothetical protein NP233_g3398 [Leucocoprinus birnbaumii]|uniref:Protein phosphatase methylesterase 1 n=1 Tax=Leucocoprinus birnbaumii TaxID=56174 RepID=A0AAD5W0D8_9AGAR|nr:hypothetical protein NP233_g3398 [Leucocoprinus birnbaumii]
MSDLFRSAMSARISKLPPDIPVYEDDDEEAEAADSIGVLPGSDYFTEAVQVAVPARNLDVRVYYTPAKFADGTVLVCHHGAGYSGLSFACFAKEVMDQTDGECGVLALDTRRHGQHFLIRVGKTTSSADDSDLSINVLVEDFFELIKTVFPDPASAPTLLLVGHSMGGSVVVQTCPKLLERKYKITGTAVLDVVEGSAIEALPHMHSLLNARPEGFDSIEEAIEWHVTTNTIRNPISARISIPAIIKRDDTAVHPYQWRTPLRSTAPYWQTWFTGLSNKFLAARTARLLVLAGTDRLDKELMIGQMQGKFQLVVVPGTGHMIQERQRRQKCAIAEMGLKAGEPQKRNRASSLEPVQSRLWSDSSAKMLLSTFLILAASIAFHKYSFTWAADSNNIVDVGYARYLGNQTTTWPNTVSYLGIPYAEPPTGNRRFRAPLPLNTARIEKEAGGKVIDARSYPNFCIQGALFAGDHGGAGSEDCLKVNIYAPAGVKANAKLPVLVYIHGGGYVFGNPANWPFEHWIQQSPNVVIVSVYYRLSGFGFLATPEFSSGKLGDLNAGFMDQIEALRWVQRHISKFGGDPNQVTINGESAGGSSIELHLIASAGTEKLFHAGIAQSVYRTPLPTPEQQQPLFDSFAQKAGCGTGDLTAKMACLRSASVSALAIAQDNATATLSGYNAFHPVVDKKVLTDFPTRLIQDRVFRKVPLIVGATTNETVAGGSSIAAASQAFFPSLTDAGLDRLEQAYPSSSFASDDLRQQTITGDISLRCARAIMASAWNEAHVNTWTYRYNQPDPAGGSSATAHAAENYMMFRGTHTGVNGTTTFSTFNPSEIAFSEELIAYWLSFVRTLNPNTHKLGRSPSWPSYSVQRRNRIVLNEAPAGSSVDTVSGSHGEIEMDEEVQRCMVVAGLVNQMQD